MIYRLIASTDKAKTFLNQMMMKHLLRNLWIVALIVCCNFQQVFAQQLPPIPIDKDVRIGKLDNGLTYYIRKNSLPANRADFYIAHRKRTTNAVLPTSSSTCASMEPPTFPETP